MVRQYCARMSLCLFVRFPSLLCPPLPCMQVCLLSRERGCGLVRKRVACDQEPGRAALQTLLEETGLRGELEGGGEGGEEMVKW